MFDIEFRHFKSQYIEPLLRPIASTFHPLALTIMSLLSGIASLLALYFDHLLPAVLLWILCRIFDGLDGMAARLSNRQSDLGAYVDLVVDFFLYAALPLVIAIRSGETAYFAAAALLLGIFYCNAAVWMVSSTIFEKRGMKSGAGQTSIIMPRGLVEGFETMLFNCFMLGFPQFFVPLALAMAGLTFLGALLRFAQTLRILLREDGI